MSIEDYATYREIKSQAEAWRNALEIASAASLPNATQYEQVIFTGCGSTYYLSLAAAALYQELTGYAARAVPAGELFLNPQVSVGRTLAPHDLLSKSSAGVDNPSGQDDIPLHEKILLVAISRSGTTTETVKAVEKFKKGYHGDVLVISTYDSSLSALGDHHLIISKGQEESIAQTRSFTSMYVAATAFCARMAGREDLVKAMAKLPEIGKGLIGNYESFAKEIGENLDFDRFYFLGSGIRYGLACEANLKIKEMTLTHSEPFHFLEFRHGPMSMVNEKTVIVGLLSESNVGYEKAVLNEMQVLGGMTVALAESDADISFESRIPENVGGVLYLPILQLMAFYRSLAKGLNPDRPKNLTAVVQLNL
jgi:glucosamine--fructose-6-phosphate aminotransferase (isomerizing)